jgi:hypothetical protein
MVLELIVCVPDLVSIVCDGVTFVFRRMRRCTDRVVIM